MKAEHSDETNSAAASERNGSPPSTLPPADSDVLIGTTLHETYAVQRVIGEGGMGRVYEARHTRIKNKRFALKVLHAEYAANTELQLRFQREAEAAAAIEHPAVVGTYDIGRTPQGSPYLVSEFLQGRDLNSYIVEVGALPERVVLRVGIQLCRALAAAHAENVIHRDMKPHNVFVLGSGELEAESPVDVKVLDFGLSRFVDHDSQLTKTGVVLGTPGYMSPEQAQGQETTKRTDIYGIGAILYAAATGRPPFKEKTPQLTVLAVMHREPQRPRDVEPRVSAELEWVIQRAMAREPQQRFATPEEMEQELLQLLGEPTQARRSLPEDAGPTAARTRLLMWLLAAFGLLAAWALTAFSAALHLVRAESPTGRIGASFVAAGACLLAPVFIWRRLRATVWNNTAHVVDALKQARPPVATGLAAYGASALLVRVLETGIPSLSQPLHEWRGWGLSLALVGAIYASFAAVVASPKRSRLLPPRLLFALAFVLGLLVLASSVSSALRGVESADALEVPPSAPNVPPKAPAPTRSGGHERIADGLITARDGGRADAGPTALSQGVADSPIIVDLDPTDDSSLGGAPNEQHADVAELSSAVAEGAAALESLTRSYPRDPEVHKALVLAYAARASTLASSVDAIRRLLRIDIDYADDSEVRIILTKALTTDGAPQKAAFSVLENEFDVRAGALVFDLLVRAGRDRTTLNRLFLRLRRKAKTSSPVNIAYDLRFAPSCSARVKYLPQARAVGDIRAIAALLPLVTPPRGCQGRQCRVQCESEAEAFESVLAAIRARLGGDSGMTEP